MLQPEVLQPLIRYLMDPLYAKDVALIMRRAGERGTQILLDLLVEAPTYAERRAYMQALQYMDTGMDMLIGMLNHPEWFVVRNVADVIGEMQLEEAVTALGNAGTHPDRRVRLSAGMALARIGSPSANKYLGKLLRDDEPSIRMEIAKSVRGTGLGALAMPLANAAETEDREDIQCELYRALGRVGTNDAVTALIKATEPVGLLKGLRSSQKRVAATEGLASAGGDRAMAALRELATDRDKHVRAAAEAGLSRLEGGEATTAEVGMEAGE